MPLTRALVLSSIASLAFAAMASAEEPKPSAEAATPASVELAAGDALGLAVFADRSAVEPAKPVGLATADPVPSKLKR